MYLNDDIQETLRKLGKISQKEVVKKEGDIYLALNVLTNESRILATEKNLIEALSSDASSLGKKILKG